MPTELFLDAVGLGNYEIDYALSREDGGETLFMFSGWWGNFQKGLSKRRFVDHAGRSNLNISSNPHRIFVQKDNSRHGPNLV